MTSTACSFHFQLLCRHLCTTALQKKHKPCQISSINTTHFCKTDEATLDRQVEVVNRRDHLRTSQNTCTNINVTPQLLTTDIATHCKTKHVNSLGMCSIFFREIAIPYRTEHCVNRLDISALFNTHAWLTENQKSNWNSPKITMAFIFKLG